jgi:hypothetical protein
MKLAFTYTLILLIVITNMSHADPNVKTSNLPGYAFLRIIAASSKYKSNCNAYEERYRAELEKPITAVEKQLASIWGDWWLCLCRVNTKSSGHTVAFIPAAYAEEATCQLSDEAYGPYGDLVRALNKTWKQSDPPLLEMMRCTSKRINGKLSSDIAFKNCLNEK